MKHTVSRPSPTARKPRSQPPLRSTFDGHALLKKNQNNLPATALRPHMPSKDREPILHAGSTLPTMRYDPAQSPRVWLCEPREISSMDTRKPQPIKLDELESSTPCGTIETDIREQSPDLTRPALTLPSMASGVVKNGVLDVALFISLLVEHNKAKRKSITSNAIHIAVEQFAAANFPGSALAHLISFTYQVGAVLDILGKTRRLTICWQYS